MENHHAAYTCRKIYWTGNQYNESDVGMSRTRSNFCELCWSTPENLNHEHVCTREKNIDLKINVPYSAWHKKIFSSIKSIGQTDVLNFTKIRSRFMASSAMIKTVPATIKVSTSRPYAKNESINRQFKHGWCGNKCLITQIIVIVLSAILFLAPAQGVNNNSIIGFTSDFPNTSTLNFNNTRFESATDSMDINALDRGHHIQVHNVTKDLPSDLEAKIVLKADAVTSSSHLNRQDVSMIRNSLFGGSNLLQRQLREKAKQESLESIKMHILMRLNLKTLPNITKPIPVPQNILINFYKSYNASLFEKTINHENSSPTHKAHLYATENPIKGTYSQFTNAEFIHRNSNRSESKIEDIFSEDAASPEMQGDDANAFNDFKLVYNIGLKNSESRFDNRDNIRHDSEDNESILSHISSVYVFPEQPHVRHNHKADILRFKFDNTYTEISYMTLHLYLRGWNWIGAHLPELFNGITKERHIVLSINRIMHQVNTTSSTYSAKQLEFSFKIPPGLGQWVKIDMKPLFGESINETYKSHDFLIKGAEPWTKSLFVTTDNATKNPLTVHIEIGSQKKHRRKRSVYMDCAESDQDVRCCRYPLKVNFTTFGWHFVVAPTSFDAYFCSGDCRVGYLEQYTHTHLTSLTTSASPCCSPTKMSSLSLLYFDYNNNLVLSVIPNMSVEECSCS